MTVQTKWSLQTMGLLAVGISLSVAASYWVQLTSAGFAATGWLSASLTDGMRAANESTLSELSTIASGLADEPPVMSGNDDQGRAYLSRELPSSQHRFWALVDDQGNALTSHPSCLAILRLHPGRAPNGVLPCEGEAMLVASAPVGGSRWRRLVVGSAMDDAYVNRLSMLYNVEAQLLIGDRPVASSLRDTAKRRLRVALPAGALDPSLEPHFSKVPLGVVDYAGFHMGNRPDAIQVGPRDHWFVSTRRLNSEAPVELAFLVPVSFMTMGAEFGAMIMMGVALLLLVLMALLVWTMVRRFTRPIVALSASARAVAKGDLTVTVKVPRETEMGGFCLTYNQMLHNMQQLVTEQKSLARASGMSEIATGVLHNVGNVLNSINVATSISLECAGGLKISSLERVVTLLGEHQQDLARFLTSDSRGQQLPAYLGRLTEQLAADRDRLTAELRGLVENVEHVKRIITTQQHYARGTAMVERCSLADLVDDALRMEATSLKGARIELVDEVAKLELDVDRHKMLQILVNLVSNAKHAVAAVAGPRRIRLSTSVRDGMIDLAVEDNGVGIAAGDAPRIFVYGFTTKKEGHGFGLHHSALAAKEMGGSLAVHSDGPGKGATFTLSLPLPQAASAAA